MFLLTALFCMCWFDQRVQLSSRGMHLFPRYRATAHRLYRLNVFVIALFVLFFLMVSIAACVKAHLLSLAYLKIC